MDFQEELSRSVKTPEDENREKVERDKKSIEMAEQMAPYIIERLKKNLLENVHSGKFEQHNNKGTVTAYEYLHGCRFIDMETQIIRKSLPNITLDWAHRYHFIVNEEHKAGYLRLRQLLAEWGRENQVSVTWYIQKYSTIQEPDRVDYQFPHEEWEESISAPSFPKLIIQAVSSFAIDPNHPIDYIAPEVLEQMHKEHIRKVRKSREHTGDMLQRAIRCSVLWAILGIAFIGFSCYLVYIINLYPNYDETGAWALILLFVLVMVFVSFRQTYLQIIEIGFCKDSLKKIQTILDELTGSSN